MSKAVRVGLTAGTLESLLAVITAPVKSHVARPRRYRCGCRHLVLSRGQDVRRPSGHVSSQPCSDSSREGSHPVPLRWLEIRRHSLTKKGSDRERGSQLSTGGVALARRVGEQTRAFSLVIASNVPRTVETAIAMGFAVDDTMDMGGDAWGRAQAQLGDHTHWAWPQPFVRYAEIIAGGGPVSALAERQRQLWSAVTDRIGDGESALVISHGGLIELGCVAAVRGGDYAAWGTAFGHCEGILLAHDGRIFRLSELLRLG